MMSKTWFVTGASRGIGAEIAKAALNAGHNVVATARDATKVQQAVGSSDRLLAAALDVTQENQVAAAVDLAIKQFGKIDVLVNNAGYGHLGVFEGTRMEEIRAQFETNVFGLIAVTKAVIPGMRKQRSGRIFNISSVAGLKGGFGGAMYHSSKFAVEGFSQCIAEELAPFGVYVTSISPGFVRTDFLDASSVRYSQNTISDYGNAYSEFRSFLDNRSHKQAGDPAKLGSVLVQLAEVDKPPVSFVAGSDAIEWAMSAMRTQQAQVDAWKQLSVTTDGNWQAQAQVGKESGTVLSR